MNSVPTEPINRVVSGPADVEPIADIVAPLLGEVCWEVSFSYRMVLDLHWGPRVKYNTPLGERHRGTWVLSLPGSDWIIRCTDGTEVQPTHDEGSIRSGVKILEGTVTTSFDVEFPDLRAKLGFNNGCLLKLVPEEEPADVDRPEGIEAEEWEAIEVEYWALICPRGMYLKVGPDSKWWYGPSSIAP